VSEPGHPESTACLVIHGFGGEPFDVLTVAGELEKRGVAVSVPLLPGHGTTIEDWNRSGWSDWLACVGAEYEKLRERYARVGVVGYSMGGSLALALAGRVRPDALAVIAAPVYLYRVFPPQGLDWRMPLVGLLKHLRPIWPMKPKSDRSRNIAPRKCYEGATALDALHSFIVGLRDVRANLGKIVSPLLAIYTPLDRYVSFDNMRLIVEGVGSRIKRTHVLGIEERVTGHHMLTTHLETKDAVAKLCADFVREGVDG
jgi:carboxylesterase